MGNLPIGQGISVTPMQMATAYAAIANGGILRPPHIVRRIDGERAPAAQGQRVISESTSRQLRTMLEGVFAPGGTASEVSIQGYELAGKTGTANKIDPKTGEYSQARYIASFIGFAPALEPAAAGRRRWSTSRRARSTAARSPRRRSARSRRSRCPTCGSRPRVDGRRRAPGHRLAARTLPAMTLRELLGDAARDLRRSR